MFKEKKDKEKELTNDEEQNIKESIKRKLAKKDEEIEKAKADCEHWKNEYYRVYADIANLRKEIEKDHRDVIKYRIEGLIDKLVPILDAFDMAFKVEASTDELKNYLKGFRYVYSSLLSMLEAEGVNIITPAIDSKFDEKTMQVVDTIEFDGEENLVKEVSMKGYKLYDHLIRPACVVVSKKPLEAQKVEEENQNEKNKNIA